MKEFNTEAICIPDRHYMVDISDKIQQIEKLIAHAITLQSIGRGNMVRPR